MIIPSILHITANGDRYERELWGTYTEPEEPPIGGPAGGGGQHEPLQVVTIGPDTRALEADEKQREREENKQREEAAAKERHEERAEQQQIRKEEKEERIAAAAPPAPPAAPGPPQVARQEPQPTTSVRVSSSRTSGGTGRK